MACRLIGDYSDREFDLYCPGLSPTEQSFLFKMVNGLITNKAKLMRFGLDESNQCSFCKDRDDKDHFFACPQASGMGEVTRGIIRELNPDRKPVHWHQLGSLDLNLPPVQHLLALILIAELGLEMHRTRAKKKPLQISRFTSNLKFRSEVIGHSKKFQDGRNELAGWIEARLPVLDGHTERSLSPVVDSRGAEFNGLGLQ